MNKTNLSLIIVMIIIAITLIEIPLFPKDDFITANTIIEFKKFGLSPILIDNNKEFSSPILLKKPYIIELEPDTYYWKSMYSSKINTFAIESKVAVSIKNNNKTDVIINKGNVETNLEIKNSSGIVGFAILGIREKLSINLSNEEVIASQR